MYELIDTTEDFYIFITANCGEFSVGRKTLANPDGVETLEQAEQIVEMNIGLQTGNE
jgi:hypothetical protein